MNRSRRGLWLGAALLLLVACQVGGCRSGSTSDGQGDGHASGGASASTGGAASSPGAGSSLGTGSASPGGSSTGGEAQVPPGLDDGLGAYPTGTSTPTRGGTMTFTNVGAPGSWPRRLDHFFILLDETSRAIEVGVLHPQAIPDAAKSLLPALPATLDRSVIDALLRMRLPEGG